MKFYLAASFAEKARMRAIRTVLVGYGHEVTSAWIDSTGVDVIPGHRYRPEDVARAQDAAGGDISDIRAADTVVVFTDVPSTTGGFHVELGIGIGLSKRLVVVGPILNIFQLIPQIDAHFSRESDFLSFVRNGALVASC